MLTRPFLDRWGRRLILAFGVREVTQRQLIEELVLGCWLLIPLGIFLGFITIRFLAVRYNPLPRFIRSDIWTTCVIFIVGDILMELFLLPSLQCVPLPSTPSLSQAELLHHSSRSQQSMLLPSYDISMLMWVLQFYHLEPIAFWASEDSLFPCPLLDSQYYASAAEQASGDASASANIPEHLILFTPLATACLLSLRLIFICIGVHIGESLAFPICLTGGIACGKSTVGHQLVNINESTVGDEQGSRRSNRQQQHQHQSPPKSPSKKHRKVLKKPTNAAGNDQSSSTTGSTSQSATSSIFDDDEEEREGTVYLICADSIAHEILLPPSVLSNGIDDVRVRGKRSGGNGDAKEYTVAPSDSVYNQLVDAFGEYDIFDDDGRNQNGGNGDDDSSDEQQSHDESDNDEDNDYNNRLSIDEPLIDRRKLGTKNLFQGDLTYAYAPVFCLGILTIQLLLSICFK